MTRKFTSALAPLAKTQTQIVLRRRSISFSDALIIVEWLNATRGTKECKRVLTMRRELEELGSMLVDLHKALVPKSARAGHKEEFTMQEMRDIRQRGQQRISFRDRHNALNRRLSRYALVSVLAYDIEAGIWRYNAVPKAISGRAIRVSDGGVTVDVNETSVVAALARLAVNRELYKVRLCDKCQERWRVSERVIDRFCSDSCRTEFYAMDPESRDRKARGMRDHRQNVKGMFARQDAARRPDN